MHATALLPGFANSAFRCTTRTARPVCKTLDRNFRALSQQTPSQVVRVQAQNSFRCELAAGAGKFPCRYGCHLSVVLAPGPADHRKLGTIQRPCLLHSCSLAMPIM